MNKPTATELLHLWNNNIQIRQAFITIGAYQDYVLNPQHSSIQIIENSSGKISVIESSLKQTLASSTPRRQEPQKPRPIPDPFNER